MEENNQPVNLIGKVTSKEEEQKLLKKAEEAMRAAQQLRENAVEGSDGFVRSPVQLVTAAKPTPEDREFLLLFIGENTEGDEGSEFRHWIIVKGRKAAYYAIKALLMSDYVYIDLVESKIVVDVETIKEMKTMYDFMSYVIEKDLIDDEDNYVDISEYDE